MREIEAVIFLAGKAQFFMTSNIYSTASTTILYDYWYTAEKPSGKLNKHMEVLSSYLWCQVTTHGSALLLCPVFYSRTMITTSISRYKMQFVPSEQLTVALASIAQYKQQRIV